MYEHVFQFFGLRENPFHVSPDPRFFFGSGAHARAFSELTAGVETLQGLVVLVGQPGTGKTILLHHLLNWLQARKQSSCYVFQSQLKPLELFEAILHDFGVACISRRKGDMLAGLNNWLVQRHALGDSPVLIIDEAQAISLRTLDRLRMLSNLETPGSKLLQIVLAGQPKLEEKLRRPELRQLHQRIMFRCSLEPLSSQGTSAYIKHRLAVCGASNTEIFAPRTVEAVQLHAEGIPRVINLLCEHALLAAYTEKSKVVTAEMIGRIAAEFELLPQPRVLDRQELCLELDLVPASLSEEKTRASAMTAALAETDGHTKKLMSVTGTTPEMYAPIQPKFEAPQPQFQEIPEIELAVNEAVHEENPIDVSSEPVSTNLISEASPFNQRASNWSASRTRSEADLVDTVASQPETGQLRLSIPALLAGSGAIVCARLETIPTKFCTKKSYGTWFVWRVKYRATRLKYRCHESELVGSPKSTRSKRFQTNLDRTSSAPNAVPRVLVRMSVTPDPRCGMKACSTSMQKLSEPPKRIV
jgi:general secretion pathway protein A